MKKLVGQIGLMGLVGLISLAAFAADWSNPNPRSGGDSAGQLLLKHESNMSDIYDSTGKLNLLRENFAGVASPSLPETGQAWYDTGVQMLKLYGSATWGLPGFYSSGTSSLRNIVSTGTTTVTDFVSIGTATIQTLSTTGISATTGTFGTISAVTISAGSGTVTNLNTTGTGTVASLYAAAATMPNITVTTKGTFVDLETSGTATLPVLKSTTIDAGTVNATTGAINSLSTSGTGTIGTLSATTGNVATLSATDFSTSGTATLQTAVIPALSATTGTLGNAFVTGTATLADMATTGTGTVENLYTTIAYASSLETTTLSAGTATLTNALGIAYGGTAATTKTAAFDSLSPLTTKGDVIAHDGTNNVRLGVGGNGQVIMADSTQSAGVKWADVSSVPAGDAVTLSGFHVSTTPTATMIPATGSSGKLDNGWLNTGSGNGIDADKLDGQEGSYYANASNISAGTISTAYLPTIPKAQISSSGTWSTADLPTIPKSQILSNGTWSIIEIPQQLGSMVRLASAQTITWGSTKTVLFNSESYDVANNYNIGTATLTIPHGITKARFDFSIVTTLTGTGAYNFQLVSSNVNNQSSGSGNPTHYVTTTNGSAYDYTWHDFTSVFNVAEGDTFYFKIDLPTTSATVSLQSSESWFSVVMFP